MKKQKKKKIYWRKLDDQAKIYSLSSNRKDTSIFRLSVILKKKIDTKLLQRAVELALEKYKAFKVKMKGGFFWHYLEENNKKPIISEENDYPFKRINPRTNNDYLFKVTYFNKKINIEFFHTLTDGNGGSTFFKEIICKYLQLKYPIEIKNSTNKTRKIIQDAENSYLKNYEKATEKSYNPPKAYMLKGEQLKKGKIGINHFNIKLSEIKAYSQTKKCGLSALLITMIAYSLYETNYKLHKGKEPINICVPINLKNYFPSQTISNFVSYMMISIRPKHNQIYSFNDILDMVNKEFKKKLKFEKIIATMSSNGKIINNIFVRLVPLRIKRLIVGLSTLEFKRHFTTTFSNIGICEFDNKYKKYINNFYFLLAPDWSEKIRCGVCSYEDNLVVTFGTNLNDTSIQSKFKNLLREYGIKFKIEGNGITSI